MTARDELLRTILSTRHMYAPHLEVPADIVKHVGNGVADAILAAGYRLPWSISTAAERAILQPGTICMDEHGNAWKRGTGSWVSTGGDTGPLYDEDDITLTILHEGTQP